MRVIAVTNQKGGTGKTTTVVNLGFALAQSRCRTLLVDLDAQGNLGVSFGIDSERSLYHILVDGADPNACALSVRPNLDLIPSNETAASAELPTRIETINSRQFVGLLYGAANSCCRSFSMSSFSNAAGGRRHARRRKSSFMAVLLRFPTHAKFAHGAMQEGAHV